MMINSSVTFAEKIKSNFNQAADFIFAQLNLDEDLNLNIQGEDSLFVRFNNSQVRQNTSVEQLQVTMKLQKDSRTVEIAFNVTGNLEADQSTFTEMLALLRVECSLLPPDEFQVKMENNGTSDNNFTGKLLPITDVFSAVITPAAKVDFAGLYCAGPIVSGNRNSKGQSHWFATEMFFLDYSLYLGEKAVKNVYAGNEWNQDQYEANLSDSKNQLSMMDRPKKVLVPGAYRTYLAPGAVAELSGMLSWGALSFKAYKRGNSALGKLADKEKSLSPLLNVKENFKLGLTHQFNELGEVSPTDNYLIKAGQIENFIISSRSAIEFNVTGNASNFRESPRSMDILPGTLKKEDILKELGTGLYLSNLHYLNWSDMINGRITGMTRYACFWVENGEIVAPIADLRFDETLYECLGENLLAITDFQEIEPNVDTYEARSLGGKRIPGMLIKNFKFTL